MKTKCLLHCTMGKPLIYFVDNEVGCIEKINGEFAFKTSKDPLPLNGRIVAECEIECEEMYTDENGMSYYTDTIKEDYMVSKCACLDDSDIYDYLGNNIGYALHINNLKVFDKPMELSKLVRSCLNDNCLKCKNFDSHYFCPTSFKIIDKAPRNMCWCYYKGERYCLISTRPECVAKIFNGEKTIEIRKKVLKEML